MTYSYGGSITENMVLPSGEMAEGTIPAAFGALGQRCRPSSLSCWW
ncbi:hypothetical protein LNQ03_03920 [Klebsiella pneumoniae subsp. pneumoniae]|nr:hypothetical protein [Klebsiella pneumoniae subsp. pneumoniae]